MSKPSRYINVWFLMLQVGWGDSLVGNLGMWRFLQVTRKEKF
jgi:hypothetical protein